jgi:hypothetical protein
MKVLVGFNRKTAMVETRTSGFTNGGIPRNELRRQIFKTVCTIP